MEERVKSLSSLKFISCSSNVGTRYAMYDVGFDWHRIQTRYWNRLLHPIVASLLLFDYYIAPNKLWFLQIYIETTTLKVIKMKPKFELYSCTYNNIQKGTYHGKVIVPTKKDYQKRAKSNIWCFVLFRKLKLVPNFSWIKLYEKSLFCIPYYGV